jgi:ADP-ribose pyrophosphatase
MKWEILERSLCYQGFFRLERLILRHALFSGGESGPLVRELVWRADAVAVLPYDPRRDAVVLVEQFRVGALESPSGPWMLEIVAGLVDEGEHREAAAARETREETGCRLRDLIPIHEYYSTPGGFKERVSLYLGRVDAGEARAISGQAAEGEDIRVHVMDVEEAIGRMRRGLFESAQPIIALQWLEANRDAVRERWA